MGVAVLVVDERPLAGGVLDVPLRDRSVFRLCGLRRELEHVECRAGVAARVPGDPQHEVVVELDPELSAPRARDQGEVVEREWLELVDLAARQQSRVDLEVRVLRGRADERDEPLLHGGQERILLRLVEAVDLVEEEDRPLAVAAELVTGPLDDPADIGDCCRDGGMLLESGPGRRGDDAGERRLAAAGRDRRRSTRRRDPRRSRARARSPARRPSAGRRSRRGSRV